MSSLATRLAAHVVVVALAAIASGCTDLESIGPGSGRLCGGSVIGTSDAAFIRSGFCENVTLELVFRPVGPEYCRGAVPSDSPYEALLTTSDGAFHCAPVRIVGPIEQDLLGRYDFPGDRRLENKIYTVRRTSGPDDGSVQDAILFVSFLDAGGVEVRLLAGAGGSATGDGCGPSRPRDLFGLFRLTCTQ